MAQGSWNGALAAREGNSFCQAFLSTKGLWQGSVLLVSSPKSAPLSWALIKQGSSFFVPPLKSLVCLWERLIRYPTAHELLPDPCNGVYKPCIVPLQDHPIGSKKDRKVMEIRLIISCPSVTHILSSVQSVTLWAPQQQQSWTHLWCLVIRAADHRKNPLKSNSV